jgi:hypothetical protein
LQLTRLYRGANDFASLKFKLFNNDNESFSESSLVTAPLLNQDKDQHNPFAPPTAAVIDSVDTAPAQPFYVVSLTKYWIMMVGTIGAYGLYWFYKNWAIQKERNNEKIWPVPRAIFNIFFTHSLLRRAQEVASARTSKTYNVGGIATTYVVAIVLSNFIDRAAPAFNHIGATFAGISFLVFFIGLFALSHGQRLINIACDDEQGTSNARLTAANWAWLAVGAILIFLSLYGLFATPVSS